MKDNQREGFRDLEKAIEFPDYCIMNSQIQARLMAVAMGGHIKSRNACVGCGIYDCFGNTHYTKQLTENEQRATSRWREYISNRV